MWVVEANNTAFKTRHSVMHRVQFFISRWCCNRLPKVKTVLYFVHVYTSTYQLRAAHSYSSSFTSIRRCCVNAISCIVCTICVACAICAAIPVSSTVLAGPSAPAVAVVVVVVVAKPSSDRVCCLLLRYLDHARMVSANNLAFSGNLSPSCSTLARKSGPANLMTSGYVW